MRAGADLQVFRRRGAAPDRRDAAVGAPGVDVEITREAVGVVGIITPWNFPIAIPAWKIAPALAYGNTVVFKPADLVPGCAWALVEILHRGRPAQGRVQPRHGRGLGRRPGASSISPDVDGDHLHRLGQAIGARVRRGRASSDRRRVQLEMGGKNPLVVLDDADLERRGRVRGRRRLLLDRPALHGLVAPDRHRGHPRPVRRRRWPSALQALKVGDALDRRTPRSARWSSQSQLEQDTRLHRRSASDEGAKLVAGGELLQARERRATILPPALFADTRPTDAHQPRRDLRAGRVA